MANSGIPFESAPLGATPGPDGTTFRVWAPRARQVYVVGDFNAWQVNSASLLKALGDETWAGFFPSAKTDSQYRFHIAGLGGAGTKRDPRARALTLQPAFPNCHCLVRDPAAFPWHNVGWRPPPYPDWVIYQLHAGTFRISPGAPHGYFLDVALQVSYFQKLGVNALQLLPIVEFPTEFSLGYNGTDYYSPETDYAIDDDAELQRRLAGINALFQQRGQPGYPDASALRGADNQLRVLVDLCHVWGLAVLLDVVYNHAGGGFDEQSMYFLDRLPKGNNNDSLYFTDQGFAGGLVFAFWNQNVRRLLTDNPVFFQNEYRVDGFRFDEVSTMDRFGGWQTSQEATTAARANKPEGLLIAEYWPVNPSVAKPVAEGGAGFDATWQDELREAVRQAIGQASAGAGANLDLQRVAGAIGSTRLLPRWRAIHCVENHDIVKAGAEPRVAQLADPSNPRSWYSRSRARVATALLLTAPGIPMLFMGQEILEQRPWSDNPNLGLTPAWNGLDGNDPAMANHLRFTTDCAALRRRHPALRSDTAGVFHAHDGNRVIAFQRWLEGIGRNVVVVATLRETTWYNYDLGFPLPGRWLEVFNSDRYDNWPNPIVVGNGGQIIARDEPLHGLPASTTLVIPANSVLVFARDPGDA
jgi:1,4-alpha-glucan branching enzyme